MKLPILAPAVRAQGVTGSKGGRSSDGIQPSERFNSGWFPVECRPAAAECYQYGFMSCAEQPSSRSRSRLFRWFW